MSGSATPSVLLETLEPGIARMTMNRPDRRNAIDAEWLAACEDHLAALDASDPSRLRWLA